MYSDRIHDYGDGGRNVNVEIIIFHRHQRIHTVVLRLLTNLIFKHCHATAVIRFGPVQTIRLVYPISLLFFILIIYVLSGKFAYSIKIGIDTNSLPEMAAF